MAKPWGGNRLASVLGRKLPPGGPYGESWEVSGYPGRVSRLAGGDSLADLALRDPEGLLGRPAAPGEPFPLLFKFIDAQEALSVQVHPAETTGGQVSPKQEAWLVLASDPGAILYIGLTKTVSPDELRSRALDGTIPDILRQVPAVPGAFHHVAAGTIHAIGGGVLLAEIQQVSDTTYRLYDWGRVDSSGRPRDLHIEEALDAASLVAWGHAPFGMRTSRTLVRTSLLPRSKFTVETLSFHASHSFAYPTRGRFEILVVLDGHGRLLSPEGDEDLSPGRTLLLPASIEHVSVACDEELFLLRFTE